MTLIGVTCYKCGRKFTKELGRYNESIKFGWKFYCSPNCQNKIKNKQQILKCNNPLCGKEFKRQLHEILGKDNFYCSCSCAATVNNSKFPKRKVVILKCSYCGNDFSGKEKYCSGTCKNLSQILSREFLINEIQEFYLKNKRIPLKKEFPQAKAVRLRFGSWNKGIITAGLRPNPVKFARKHTALDGHRCDSFAEFIIDNWLHKHNVQHKIHVPCPNSNMSSDFLINDIRLEFIGLEGESKKYDQLLLEKRQLVKKQKLRVIEIFPEDLFPKNKLSQLLHF